MVKTIYSEKCTSTRARLLGDFPQPPEDVPLFKSRRPGSYVLGLVFAMVFAAELGSSISKAPLIRGTYHPNSDGPSILFLAL